jgi:hypothetical protein
MAGPPACPAQSRVTHIGHGQPIAEEHRAQNPIAWLAQNGLRMLMLTASDPASAARLRGFVQKYRTLAEHSKKQVRTLSAEESAA